MVVSWSLTSGLRACFYSNDKNYFKQEIFAKETPKVHFEDEKNRGEVDLKQVFVTPFAQAVECRLSQATSELSDTLEYVKTILEKSVLAGNRRKICSLGVRMMRDVKGKWYFIGIEEYQVEARRRNRQSLECFVLRGSCPTSRNLSPTPELPVSPSPPVSDTAKYRVKCATPQLTKQPSSTSRFRDDPGLDYAFTRDHLISDRKHYQQMLNMEANIADLLDLKSTPLSFMTYRGWKQRQSVSPRLSAIDHLYAKKLAEKERLVRKQTAHSPETLSVLRKKMLDSMAVAAMEPTQVAKNVGKLLLSRVEIKKVATPAEKLMPKKSKVMDLYKKTQNATQGERYARLMVNYAVNRMEELRRSKC